MGLVEQQQLESKYVMETFARKPVEFTGGKGMQVSDSEGKVYLDFLAGIGAASLGHCHPAVVEAVTGQVKKLIHVSNYYYIENRGEVAQHLSDLLSLPDEGGTWKTFFANSGAEANECAIKLARLYSSISNRRAQSIITLERSFHGRTLATLAATAQPSKQEAFQPLPAGFIHTPINDTDALEQVFRQAKGDICAIMLECIQGESGVHPCTDGFLWRAAELARENGALVIIDEVQSGIYRTGDKPFAFQHYGIKPDIVTVAKGVASGFPVGMCCATEEVADCFSPGDHGSTFGGSCLAVAAARATLEWVSKPGFGSQVEEVGVYLREKLGQLDSVEEVRGRGLMCACDLADGIPAPQIVDRALEAGLLINATGASTLRFLPPLVCTAGDVDAMLGKLAPLLDS